MTTPPDHKTAIAQTAAQEIGAPTHSIEQHEFLEYLVLNPIELRKFVNKLPPDSLIRAEKFQTLLLKDRYARHCFWFMVVWSIVVVVILALSATLGSYFQVPETTLSVLVGSTTANAIGLVFVIARGLFKSTASLENLKYGDSEDE